MFRKLMGTALMAATGLWSGLAHAGGFVVIGPAEFKPTASTTKYSVLAQGVQTDTAGYVVAPIVSIPVGSRITAMWCQVYDDTDAKNINVNISENITLANGGGSSGTILSLNSSGRPGHTQYATSDIRRDSTIKTFDQSGPNATTRLFSYTLEAWLDGTTRTGFKGCVIQYS